LLYRIILSSSNPGDIVLDPFFGSGTTGAVAKKLQRDWIGIERDETYIKIAQERIDKIQPGMFEDNDVYIVNRKKNAPKIPFGNLLENGLLKPGQTLFFGGKDEKTATVLSDGNIKYKDFIGSIHKAGSVAQDAPCNGWEHWYYVDETTGERAPINRLRQKFIKENLSGEKC
jgi:hypothetical protein